MLGFAADFGELLRRKPQTAHVTAVELLSNSRVSSAIVERAHTPAQELYKQRQRGVAPAAEALAMRSYQKAVAAEARRVGQRVRLAVLKKRGLTAAQFSQLSQTFRQGGVSKRSAGCPANASRKQKLGVIRRAPPASAVKRRKTDPYRQFRKEHWAVRARPGSQQWASEERRIAALWRGASDAEKAVAEGQAVAEEQARERLVAEGLSRPAIDSAGVSSTAELRRQLWADAWNDIKNHEAFDAAGGCGLGVMGPTSGLDAAQIPAELPSIAASEARTKQLFAYDSTEKENAKHSMQPAAGCNEKHWGCCRENPFIGFAHILCFNVTMKLREWRFQRSDFPLLVSFRAASNSSIYLLGDYHGVGETLILTKMRRQNRNVLLPESMSNECLMVSTGQEAFCALLAPLRTAARVPEHVDFDIFKVEPLVVGNAFALCARSPVTHCGMLPAAVKLSDPRPATAPEPKKGRLPFGLQWTDERENEEPASSSRAPTASGQPREGGNLELDADEQDEASAEPLAAVAAHAEAGAGPPAKMTSAGRVGITGFDVAPSSRGVCVVCKALSKPQAEQLVREGELRFFWRTYSHAADRSLHPGCVLDMSLLRFSECKSRHLAESAAFLGHFASSGKASEAHSKVLLEASQVLNRSRSAGAVD